jgi:dipeptidase E
MLTGHIVAMGGGGFSMEPENPRLDRFILSLARVDNPRVCFLNPASAEEYFLRFYQAFGLEACRTSHLHMCRLPTADLRGWLLEQDVIYVGGGNTRSMLAQWREWGLVDIFRECHDQGAVLAGVSAGMICWYEWGLTDSVPGTLGPLRCAGLLSGAAVPHYDGEADRRPTAHRLVASGELPGGVAADDSAALVYRDRKLVEVVCSVEGRQAYRLERDGDRCVETPLPARLLPL